MEKVAAYVRVSTTEQADAYGPDSQREKIRAWAEMEGVEPEQIDWYDDAASGGDTDRDGLQEMLDKLEDCEYDALVVYRADRLSRSLKDLLVLIEDVLDPCDCAFVSVTEPLDTSTPMGRAVLHMIGTFSELERGLITERLREGRKSKARGGGHATGEVPLGYRQTGEGGLEPDPHTAPIVRRIFNLREEGESLRSIADTLNAAGVPTKRGGDWHASTVKHVLDNPKYRGRLVQTFDGETVETEAEALRIVEE
jgi:DNA invertase Pin-like site-specific DNA recombinase